MVLIAQFLFWIAAVPSIAGCLYLLLLTLLSARLREPSLSPAACALRFDVIVPAHNESGGIARTVQSLLALDWPAAAYRILVIADNCTDDTAERAGAAGALVLEHCDHAHRGKGYALQWAFAHSLQEAWADAVVVVDADSVAKPGLLRAFAARLARGATAIQANYGVLNPDDSWRTRLMTVALGAFHDVRSRGRERLGLSCGIRGNGWCLAAPLLRSVPYDAFGLTEDVEYGIRLGLAGCRVHYADEAGVQGEVAGRATHAASQRRRWEQGRLALRNLRMPLLRQVLHLGDAVCADLLLDLLLPPLSQLGMWLAGTACIAAVLEVLLHVPLPAAGAVLGMAAASLVFYVFRGWQLSGLGGEVLFDFLRVPYFVAWKLAVLSRQGSGEWLRTGRERP